MTTHEPHIASHLVDADGEPMTTLDDVQEAATKSGIRIPGWAIWAIGIGLLPWGTWVTMTLATGLAQQQAVETAIAQRERQSEQNALRITAVEARNSEVNAAMRVVEATRFTAANGRELTAAIESRLDRLEVKFDSMRRDLDRAGVKSPPP